MASTDISLFAYEQQELKKEKSPTALRTISEVAEILDVPQHVLRFWETKFSQIKPLKRNGGRRFYRPQDIDVLQQIKHLLYNQGYTIKGAKKAIDDFLNARSERDVSSDVWMATVPPASVNDNYDVALDGAAEEVMEQMAVSVLPGGAEAATLLADIARSISEPVVVAAVVAREPVMAEETLFAYEEVVFDEPAVAAPMKKEGPSLEVLRTMRAELAALRDTLTMQLHTAAVYQ